MFRRECGVKISGEYLLQRNKTDESYGGEGQTKGINEFFIWKYLLKFLFVTLQ